MPRKAKRQLQRGENKSRRSFLVLGATLKWVAFPYSSERFDARSLLLQTVDSVRSRSPSPCGLPGGSPSCSLPARKIVLTNHGTLRISHHGPPANRVEKRDCSRLSDFDKANLISGQKKLVSRGYPKNRHRSRDGEFGPNRGANDEDTHSGLRGGSNDEIGPNSPSPSGLKSFCLGTSSLTRHVARWLCSSLDSLPQGKNLFGVTHIYFSDSL